MIPGAMVGKSRRDGLCLVMIVRNEAPVIRRCLASVLPIIDLWVVVDTGSIDGPQQIVAECLQARHCADQLDPELNRLGSLRTLPQSIKRAILAAA
jgi:hypothetical protein